MARLACQACLASRDCQTCPAAKTCRKYETDCRFNFTGLLSMFNIIVKLLPAEPDQKDPEDEKFTTITLWHIFCTTYIYIRTTFYSNSGNTQVHLNTQSVFCTKYTLYITVTMMQWLFSWTCPRKFEFLNMPYENILYIVCGGGRVFQWFYYHLIVILFCPRLLSYTVQDAHWRLTGMNIKNILNFKREVAANISGIITIQSFYLYF